MNLFNKYRSIFWYGVLFLGLTVAVIFEYQFFYSKYQEFSNAETDLKQKIEFLETRNKTLTSLSPEITEASQIIASVLPSENAVLYITSQIRTAALNNQVTLKNLNTSSVSEEINKGSGYTQVGVIAEGESASVMQFLANLTTLAPLIVMDSVNIITNSATTTAQLALVSYWAPFPEKLPSITEPIAALSEEELKLLEKLNNFTEPIVSSSFETEDTTPININTSPFSPLN